MKQSLQIKMGQSLAMTPQLQQAIKLLQLSTLELQTEIQSALESNPMLEMQDEDVGEPREGDSAAESAELREANRAEQKASEIKTSDDFDSANSNSSETLPEELPVDSAWEDVYESSQPPSSSSTGSDGESRDFTEFHNSGISTIQDHLRSTTTATCSTVLTSCSKA